MRSTAALALALILGGLFAPSPAQSAARGQALYPCNDQVGFVNTTLTIVTTVNPSAGMTWKFDSAPSVVAQRILADLNDNTGSITFKEANGVIPNLYLTVTMSETNSGTQQDQAWVSVTGLARAGTLFSDSSGPAAFVGWQPAVDKLSSNMLVWLQQGWHGNPPCRRPDGSTRTQWPDTYTGSSGRK